MTKLEQSVAKWPLRKKVNLEGCDCCGGGYQLNFTWNGCGLLFELANMYFKPIERVKVFKSLKRLLVWAGGGVGINLRPFGATVCLAIGQ